MPRQPSEPPQFFSSKELAARRRKPLSAIDLRKDRGQRPFSLLGASNRFRREDVARGRRPA
jgi:hypothetical protein